MTAAAFGWRLSFRKWPKGDTHWALYANWTYYALWFHRFGIVLARAW